MQNISPSAPSGKVIEDLPENDTPDASTNNDNGTAEIKPKKNGFFSSITRKILKQGDIREALADFIDDNNDDDKLDYVARNERDLISNVLKLRDMTVYDVMVPRVDIIAIDVDSNYRDIINIILEKQHSRIPVYRDNLDNTFGFIHLKDLLNRDLNDDTFDINTIVRELPILSPALPVLDLLLQMKQTKLHMALVIDEFGGIDGLVTIEDITEAIVGEISDEFDTEKEPELVIKPEDSSIIADARIELDDLMEVTKITLGSEDELYDIDTLGGYITNKIGRVPARGEVLRDRRNGIIFEIIDADPRRISRVRIRKLNN